MSFDLRAWLRRAPKPFKLRIKDVDGEERDILLGKGRTRWHATEETVRTSGAVSVQCLSEDGTILRAQRLSEDDIEADPETDGAKQADKAVSKERRELAGLLDAYGNRMNQSFREGAAAASVSQDKLVELVEVLTGHLAIAITNINNLSVNLSNAIQATARDGDGGGSQNAALLAQVMGLALGAGPSHPPAPNGKPKEK
jgi:hypothetical protein